MSCESKLLLWAVVGSAVAVGDIFTLTEGYKTEVKFYFLISG